MKKSVFIVLMILVVLHLLLGIWWLAISWGFVWFVVWLSTSSNRYVVRFRNMTYIVYPLILIGVVLLAITLKTLFFGLYKIPSGSMEKTIVPGDIVWVNNQSYGPRLPYSPYEVSWINGLVWLIEGRDADIHKRWWEYKRLKGYSSPKRGDISVFNHPYHNTIFIKRIVALPGDTLQIVDTDVIINGEMQKKPPKAVYYCKSEFNKRDEARQILDSMQISMFQNHYLNEKVQFNGSITYKELEALQKYPRVIEAGIDVCRPDTAWTVYPKQESLGWNIDNYGPYVVPFKGMTVELTPENLMIYGQLIQHERQLYPENERDSCEHFIFYNDYYFIMGDNYHDSEDSRYFGPVKEELLIGKAAMILYSKSGEHRFKDKLFFLNSLYSQTKCFAKQVK